MAFGWVVVALLEWTAWLDRAAFRAWPAAALLRAAGVAAPAAHARPDRVAARWPRRGGRDADRPGPELGRLAR